MLLLLRGGGSLAVDLAAWAHACLQCAVHRRFVFSLAGQDGETDRPQSVKNLKKQQQRESRGHKGSMWLMQLALEIRAIQREPQLNNVIRMIESVNETYAAADAKKPVVIPVAKKIVAARKQHASRMWGGEDERRAASRLHGYRHLYDDALLLALKTLEERCMKDFLQSSSYNYLLELRVRAPRLLPH